MDSMLLLLVVFAVMMIPMFLMSSRQRKAQRAQQEMLAQIGVGDEVRTHSGFYGLIVEEYDETVVLESEDGSQLKWARAAIALRVDPADGTPVLGTDAEREADAHDAGSRAADPADHVETERPTEDLDADRYETSASRDTDRL